MALLLLIIILVLVLFIGAAVEKTAMDKVGSTDYLYDNTWVCGSSNDGNAGTMATFDNRTVALAADNEVINCGKCGECSNKQDITIYNETLDTLTDTTTQCALLSFFGAGNTPTRACNADAMQPCPPAPPSSRATH
jgi:hypothetical protein